MRQVFQDLKDGATTVEEVPVPAVPAGHLLVRTGSSLISAGTERMLADFGRSSYLQKARQKPEKVKQVLDKSRTDGLLPTVEAIRHKLSEPLPMGYANAGTIVAVGDNVDGFAVGDRVASNGPHAEFVVVPTTLAGRIPNSPREISFDEAAFSTVGAIALQSIRLAQPTLGERFVVSGLGLVGLLAAQLLRAHGCHVLGLDLIPGRVALAQALGIEAVAIGEVDPLDAAERFADGGGVDGVIVAAATSSSEPIQQAAEMSRKRGRIVLVGVTGMELQRSDFYEKELTFQVSCSYGPGRYDDAYERNAQDYPLAFVRWTSARNQRAVLEMLADGRLDVTKLVTHRYEIDDAASAYGALTSERDALGILLRYPAAPAEDEAPPPTITVRGVGSPGNRAASGAARIGFIGAGNFTQRTLLPALRGLDASLVAIASQTGATAATAARKFGFERATSDTRSLIEAEDIDTLFITTRHDTHAELVRAALEAGKHVYVEKPLGLTIDEVDRVERCLGELRDPPVLHVGFNRRFSPAAQRARAVIASSSQPVALVMTINAGRIPADHWTQDPKVGGGRIIGEACHFVDLACFLTKAAIAEANAAYLDLPTRDTTSMSLKLSDGSIASINYLANGNARIPKERIECFVGGNVLSINNFRTVTLTTPRRRTRTRARTQDKGHAASVRAFLDVAQARRAPIWPGTELFDTSRAVIRLAHQ